jgi:hypothetical protein
MHGEVKTRQATRIAYVTFRCICWYFDAAAWGGSNPNNHEYSKNVGYMFDLFFLGYAGGPAAGICKKAYH